MIGATTIVTATGASSESLSQSHPPQTQTQTPRQGPVYNPEQCLLCNKLFDSFDASVAHMQTAHGLFVPHRDNLIVDLETLFAYLHLVIVGYNECICCGTQRQNTLAVQQHMLGKGHCRFDLDHDDSEYADFYDFSGSEAEAEEDSEEDDQDSDDSSAAPTKGKEPSASAVRLDDNYIRLPSGRVISNRSQPQRDARRQPLKPKSRSPGRSQLLEVTPTSTSQTSPEASSSAAPAGSTPTSTSLITQQGKAAASLTKAERQELRFTKKLASLSAKDALAIAHLPQSEQRALIATRQQQVEKAARLEERYRGRLEGLGNKFLMTHFVKDAADKRTLWK